MDGLKVKRIKRVKEWETWKINRFITKYERKKVKKYGSDDWKC